MDFQQSADMAHDIAIEIGPELVYTRPPAESHHDRLYLTGVEVAIFIGTTLLISFCNGLLKGVGKSIEASGERLGKAGSDIVISKLQKLLTSSADTSLDDLPLLEKKTSELQDALDQIINGELLPKFAHHNLQNELYSAAPNIKVALKDELARLGFPPEKATAQAERIYATVANRWLAAK